MFDLIVVGAGIASHALLEHLSPRSVLWLSQPRQAPPASLLSVAIVARRGVQTGRSPLGDLLVEGFARFSRFAQGQPGVTQAPLFHLGPDGEALKRRFKTLIPINHPSFGRAVGHREEAFLIDPAKFLDDWGERLNKRLEITRQSALVTRISESSGVQVHTLEGRTWNARAVFWGAGAYRALMPTLPLSGRSVPGHRWQWTPNWQHPPFALDLGRGHLIWRPPDLILGAGTENGSLIAPGTEHLKSLWQEFRSRVPLPAMEEAAVTTGLRHREAKRQPRAGPVAGFKRVYHIGGLYKNGYTLAWALAPRLANNIESGPA